MKFKIIGTINGKKIVRTSSDEKYLKDLIKANKIVIKSSKMILPSGKEIEHTI